MSAPAAHARVMTCAVVIALIVSACTAKTGGSGSHSTSAPALVADRTLLGDPQALPSGGVDKAAAALAGAVLKGGPQAMPALLAAIRASGLGIRDLADGGRVTLTPAAPSQGLAFQAGEVLAMSKLLARGYVVSLGDVAAIITGLDKAFAKAPAQQFLLDGIAKAAASNSPTRRMWGRFIVELGKQASPSYDLTGPTAGSAQLDAVQAMFVLQRLFGDLVAKVGALPVPTPAASLAAGPVRLAAVAPTPLCNPGEREAEILDAAGVATSYGFEQFIDWAAEHLEAHALENYAKAIPFANGILAIIKFIATMATFKGELELVDGEPLIRTQDTNAGEDRKLKVTVKVDTGKSTFLNCLRLIFNGAGLDFSLPADGPVDGAEITWTLLSGNKWVRLCALPCGKGGTSESTARTGHTGEAGEATLGVQGVPQKHKLPATVTAVKRRAVVRAGVNLKPAKLFRDLTDAAGAAGGGGAGVVIFPAELLTRIGFFGAGLGFAVTDWGEQWKVDAKLRVDHLANTSAGSYWAITWNGIADVDADGTVTGDGTGSLSGSASGGDCSSGGTTSVVFSGNWPVTFSGEKVGDEFHLGLNAPHPVITMTGPFGNCTQLVRQILTPVITDEVINVGRKFGTDLFAFPAGREAHLSAGMHIPIEDAGLGTLTITTTQVK